MAPTRPATNGPTPKSAPTTQNNGIKKSSKLSEQQIYVVSRETNDPEGVHDNHEIVGSFKTLAAANAAARDDLIKGWGREYFETYEASEVDGMVHVIATCPDGEEMVVLVEKSRVKATPPPKIAKQCTYTVTRESIGPYYPGGDVEVLGTYETLDDANEVARNDLTEGWGDSYFEDLEVEEVDGMVRVDAMCPDGERVAVRIEKNLVKKSDMAKEAAARKPVDETPRLIMVYHVIYEMIDYHNDPNGGAREKSVKGTYVSLEKANEAARKELFYEWDRDFFEEYDEEVDHGMVTIDATCPEGEQMSVYVKRGTLTTDYPEMVRLVEKIEDEMEDESEEEESEDGSEEE